MGPARYPLACYSLMGLAAPTLDPQTEEAETPSWDRQSVRRRVGRCDGVTRFLVIALDPIPALDPPG